ncbi:hypothetical protein A9Q88_12870 [Gammaproteobacteria bacterium 50_400_T64]|nr:hypothetical protein A9Q88_12870 [Gammaproteobacteria bacterium 50_400_T64]
MDRTILRVGLNAFESKSLNETSKHKPFMLADLVAKQIFKELQMVAIPSMSAFVIYTDSHVSMDIRIRELRRVIDEFSGFPGIAAGEQIIEAVLNRVFEYFSIPLNDTVFGRSLIMNLSSVQHALELEVEIDGESQSVHFPIKKIVNDVAVYENGIFMIDSISRSKSLCQLVCCKTDRGLEAKFSEQAGVREEIESNFFKSPYVEFSCESYFSGEVRRKGSFVILNCLRFFTENDYAMIREDAGLESYFSVVDRVTKEMYLPLS